MLYLGVPSVLANLSYHACPFFLGFLAGREVPDFHVHPLRERRERDASVIMCGMCVCVGEEVWCMHVWM